MRWAVFPGRELIAVASDMATIPAGEFTMGRTKITSDDTDEHAASRPSRRSSCAKGDHAGVPHRPARGDESGYAGFAAATKRKAPSTGRTARIRRNSMTIPFITSTGKKQRLLQLGQKSGCLRKPNGNGQRGVAWNRKTIRTAM